ncbi:hypothetical protein LZ906_016230 (plasmid) [Paraclostridium ghonii]|uniref:hypothetical protein n=1 Tax=Paraclostridium ghonii TaxID=29358 RepID=UPI00202CDEA8|nr:hypothetical protein [Paeniclostridium ghonii]MCM0165075.1 hypothetical protein [Paeniclostridium ghonii]
MLSKENKLNLFNFKIENAIRSLQNNDFNKAKEYILSAIMENYNSAEPHNLLGIYYELQGELNLARKHYRVAICLNQNLECAHKNLERLCTFKYVCSQQYVDYGESINKN